MLFIGLQKFPYIPNLLSFSFSFFNHEYMLGLVFSVSVETVMWFSFFFFKILFIYF